MIFDKIRMEYKEDVFENEKTLPEQVHEDVEIDFFTSADVKMFIRNTPYHIKDGDLMVVNENTIHHMIYSPGRKYCRYILNIDKKTISAVFEYYNIPEVLEHFFFQKTPLISLSVKKRAKFEEIFEALYEIYQKKNKNLSDEAQFQSIFLLMICALEKIPRGEIGPDDSPAENEVRKIMAYIEQNFRDKLTLEILSERMFLSKYYICHIFKKYTGFSVTEYIQYCRIMCAQKMIREQPEKNLTEICYDCGFGNIQHFYRVFHRFGDMTPLEYKNNAGGKL